MVIDDDEGRNRIVGDKIDEEKKRSELEEKYICISRDPLITASSVFRRLSFPSFPASST